MKIKCDYCRLISGDFVEFCEPVEELLVRTTADLNKIDAFISKHSVRKSDIPKIMVAISYDLCTLIEPALIKASSRVSTRLTKKDKQPLMILRAYAKRRLLSKTELLQILCGREHNNNTVSVSVNKIKHSTKKEYVGKLKKIAAAITAGDVYQVNFSQRFTINKHINPEKLFDMIIREINPRFAAIFHYNDNVLVSASPELFLARTGNVLISEPIKGTRSLHTDAYLVAKKKLLTSAKERSELAMVTDVIRNDMGRIAKTGSVVVTRFPAIIRLPYLIHAYAQVRCRVSSQLAFSQVIAALFPSASITGAPKLAAMEAIYTLEGSLRGFYCGSLGTISGHEDFTLSVAIRTFAITSTTVTLAAGGGIVHDSIPSAEFAESLLKAKPLLSFLDTQ